MTASHIAEYYFKLSNESNFEELKKMFCDNSTYRSGNGELFLGCRDIMAMQKRYHDTYKKLKWTIKALYEIKPGIVHIEFDFEGIDQEGTDIKYSGMEDVIIYNEKIQHIQVQRM